MRLFYLVFLLSIPHFLTAQTPEKLEEIQDLNTINLSQRDQQILDSILILIENPNTTLKEKIAIADDASDISLDICIQAKKRVIRYAKQANAIDNQINLYCSLYNLSTMIGEDINKAKLYLDSASLLIDKTDSPNMLGAFYLYKGKYLFNFPESETDALEHLQKAVHYFEKDRLNTGSLTQAYLLLALSYSNRHDSKSVRGILDRMFELEFDDDEKFYLANIYFTAVKYHENARDEDPTNYYKHNDSIIIYSKKAIEIYEAEMSHNPALLAQKEKLVDYYINLSLALAVANPPNWEQAMHVIEYSEKYIDNTTDTSWKWMEYHLTKGKLYRLQKKYTKAISCFLKSGNILDELEESQYDMLFFYDINLNLSLAYEGLGQYKEALEYRKTATQIEKQFNEEKRYEAIKDIEVKYQTLEKELEISRLNEEQQRILYNRTIIVGGLVFLAVLLTIALLFNRIKRQKKEKEALELSKRIEQKDLEYKSLLSETESRLVKRHLEGRELERKVLAKELHDSVANDVVSIMVQTETGFDRERTNLMLKNIYDQIRQISHQLMPPEFSYISLADMVEDYINLLNETTSICFDANISEHDKIFIDELPQDKAKELYYIQQEAIGNILKHAEASNVDINISYNQSKNEFTFSIVDDGKGFEVNTRGKGIGLQTMKDRARGINAKLNLESEIGKGTRIIITLVNQELPRQEK